MQVRPWWKRMGATADAAGRRRVPEGRTPAEDLYAGDRHEFASEGTEAETTKTTPQDMEPTMSTNEWPKNWDDLIVGVGCSMCRPERPTNDAYGISIYAGTYTDAVLQRARIQRGYTVVIWRGRHVAEPTELSGEEANGYWQELLKVADALLHYYRPLKMNYQTLGNSLPHLHTHLIPRYNEDPAPGWVFPLPRTGPDFPVIPEAQLERDAAALRGLLSSK
jgi:diadenosine tetraphosphate (Ap4A) HIT family hydrolase